MTHRLLIALTVLILSGCTTPGPITAAESALRLDLPDGSLPDLSRQLVLESGVRREEWTWENGRLDLYRPRGNRYYLNDYADPEDLVEELEYWNYFSEVRLDARDVEAGSNSIGVFQYATVEVSGEYCFVMIQGLPTRSALGLSYYNTSELGEGAIFVAQCSPIYRSTIEKTEVAGLRIAHALSRSR